MKSSQVWLLSILFAAGFLAACGGPDDTENSGDSEFAEAIPSDEMLTLSVDGGAGGGQAGDTYATAEQGLEGQPSRVYEHLQATADRVNTARLKTRQLIEAILNANQARTDKVAGTDCKIWTHETAEHEWQLSSCVSDRAAKRYLYALRGRPLGSTAAADYKLVVGGWGAVLPRHNELKRGHGVVGYDFDNSFALLGEGPTGKMAVGYRAAGPFRQIVVGVRDFQPVGAAQAYSALYNYKHAIGKGGHIRFIIDADMVSKDASDVLVETLDGVNEVGRFNAAWSTAGKARTSGIVCGGSLGDGVCITHHECWDAGRTVTFFDLGGDAANPPQWDATGCPADAELPVPVDGPPSEEDVTPPTADGDAATPGPALEPPAADPSLETL
ncbi:MAG: hypothetical protein AUK47_02885 [Deltaproteobacteria bacterium CG2_30_63_29]|nr:MAG: hypothetical protein AUK47_02885 [Deltaproteobacteria bacterium CG2_30_63_29]